MGYTFTPNYTNIKKLSDGAIKALGATAEAVKTEVVNAGVVPFDTGEMQRSMDVTVTNVTATITVSTPYARRMYFHPEYDFQKTNNPNAKGKWFEDWLAGGSEADFAPTVFQKLYKKCAGGVIK